MIYFNLKTNYGVETVDQLEKNDFQNRKLYRKELNIMLKSYRSAGMYVYLSQRPCKEWKKI
mgnify:CR=1 FL=1